MQWLINRAGTMTLLAFFTASYYFVVQFINKYLNDLFTSYIVLGLLYLSMLFFSRMKDNFLKYDATVWLVRCIILIMLIANGIASLNVGFESRHEIPLTLENFSSIDSFIQFQWILGTFLLPIVVYLLADILAIRNLVDLRQKQARADRENQPTLRITVGHQGQRAGTIKAANARLKQQRALRIRQVAEYLKKHPDATDHQVAQAISGIASVETVKKYRKEINDRRGE